MEMLRYPNKRDARALCIGANEYVPGAHGNKPLARLTCPDKSAKAFADLLRAKGWVHVTELTGPAATIRNLKNWLEDAAAHNISHTIVYFAGHGGRVKDADGDEARGGGDDRRDETWCMHDGHFSDDDLMRQLRKFPPGKDIVIVVDSCNAAGGMLDVNSQVSEFEAPADDAPPHADPEWHPTPTVLSCDTQHAQIRQNIIVKLAPRPEERCPPTVLYLAACRTGERAFCPNGFQEPQISRFTYGILRCLQEDPQLNYLDLIARIYTGKYVPYGQNPTIITLGSETDSAALARQTAFTLPLMN